MCIRGRPTPGWDAGQGVMACLWPVGYNGGMYTLELTPEFDAWLNGLKDRVAKLRLGRRLQRAQHGHLGDVKPVGEGVFEMREHFGPGWRMYYIQRGEVLIIMLGGGNKSTQAADIARAIQCARLED